MPVKMELQLNLKLIVNVNAHSADMSEDELRRIVESDVIADIKRHMELCSGFAGCTDDRNRTYKYNYAADNVERM